MAEHRSTERQKRRKRAAGFWWARRGRVIAGIIGVIMAGSIAFAVTNWTVGLNGGSSGEGQSMTISNISIDAIATPAATNLMYPGSTGDVVLKITNPNNFPVTITDFYLPDNLTYAAGYTDSALTAAIGGCTGANSVVTWRYSNGSSNTQHTLTSALTVAATGQANNPLTVTLTNMASMGATSPLACANAYFKMPSLTAVGATGGAATATVSPATDAWTS